VKVTPPEPERGDVYICEFGPERGSEQSGVRPAVVVERSTYARLASKRQVLVAPASTSPHLARLDFCVPVTARGGTGLRKNSYVNVSHVYSVAKERLQKRIGKIPDTKMKEIDSALKLIFDLEGE